MTEKESGQEGPEESGHMEGTEQLRFMVTWTDVEHKPGLPSRFFATKLKLNIPFEGTSVLMLRSHILSLHRESGDAYCYSGTVSMKAFSGVYVL